MKNVMRTLSNRCQKLEKNENKNINNIEELQNKIKNLNDELNYKDNIIDRYNKRINKNKEKYRILNKKYGNRIK